MDSFEKTMEEFQKNIKKNMYCIFTCEKRQTCRFYKINTQDEKTLRTIGRHRRECMEKRYRAYTIRNKVKEIIRIALPIILIVAAGIIYQASMFKMMDYKIEQSLTEVHQRQAMTDEKIFNIQSQMELLTPEE